MPHPNLPQETLDSIVDLLYEETEALKQCCLVSKSWVLRARKNLFAIVAFYTEEDIEAWKKTFPDPSDSPARYTRILVVDCAEVVTAADAAEGGWIPTFSRIVDFRMDSYTGLAPFHKLPLTLKSLSLTLISLQISKVFNLICSLPFLEGLTLFGEEAHLDNDSSDCPGQIVVPSTPPALTGTLELEVGPGIEDLACKLLDMPGGLHFRALRLEWLETFQYTLQLVAACSGTLEHLSVVYGGVPYSFFFGCDPVIYFGFLIHRSI